MYFIDYIFQKSMLNAFLKKGFSFKKECWIHRDKCILYIFKFLTCPIINGLFMVIEITCPNEEV